MGLRNGGSRYAGTGTGRETGYPARMEILTNLSPSVGAETITAHTSWQQQMKSAVRDLATLRRMLQLPEDSTALAAESAFSVFAPLPFVDRIECGNPHDPLLLQLLPLNREDLSPPHFSTDPLDEADANFGPGVLKKYATRALFVVTGACAIHCRYCFRRHFPYSSQSLTGAGWDEAIAAIAADDSIEEVILSGGDPLTVVDRQLQTLVERLGEIPHLKTLRIHTRLPIMIPSRVTPELVEMLKAIRLNVVVVIHANHANEFDQEVVAAIAKLKSSGALLLNQSVLLAGVNDDVDVLIELSKRLLDAGVLPYYLHQLDQVVGASHFEVPVEQGKKIIAAMRASLPGYAVPRYVQELPGEPNKTVLA